MRGCCICYTHFVKVGNSMKTAKKSLIFIPVVILLTFVFSLGLSEQTADRLWILCDFSMKSSPTIGTGYVSDEIYNLKRCLKIGLGLSDDEFEIEFLPTDKIEREARITALRVQIMAGGGPDVFILSGNVPGWDNLPHWEYENSNYDFLDEVSKNYGNQQRLFPDVQSAMQSGLFLPLDDYLETAEWLDPDVINSVVWRACSSEQGQMIVPLTISFPIAVYDGNILDENFAEPQNWIDGLNSNSDDIRAAYLVSARRQFADLFCELADYENEQLLFTEHELLEAVFSVLEQNEQNILDLVDKGGILSEKKYGGLLTLTLANHDDLRVLWSPYLNELTGCSEERLTDLHFTPIHNKNGGVTANIDSFIAINRNTGNPDLAFRVLDFLSSTEILNGLGGTETSDELGRHIKPSMRLQPTACLPVTT